MDNLEMARRLLSIPAGGRMTSIQEIMSRDPVCVRPDLDIAEVVNLIVGRHIGCLPVVNQRGRPIGIITKYDLVEQLDAAMHLAAGGCPLPTDLRVRTADDVMMPIALTLDEHASVAHASSMMVSEEMHHILVVSDDGTLVGIVSAKDIVRWVATSGVAAVGSD
jgi:CBS-domain-containing membrane protein